MSGYDAAPFALEFDVPPVVVSYATASAGGDGERIMWGILNALRRVGVSAYCGIQNGAGEDWKAAWFGRLADCRVCLVCLSNEYFASAPCRKEIYEAMCAQTCTVIPLIVGPTPPGMAANSRVDFFGATAVDRRQGNFVRMGIKNWCAAIEH